MARYLLVRVNQHGFSKTRFFDDENSNLEQVYLKQISDQSLSSIDRKPFKAFGGRVINNQNENAETCFIVQVRRSNIIQRLAASINKQIESNLILSSRFATTTLSIIAITVIVAVWCLN